jgi:Acetyltransferase (GNAT) domain
VNLELRPYTPTNSDTWDEFCDSAFQATFLHSRRFLSHHGDRFRDLSLIIENKGRWVGLFPAAQHPSDVVCVVSHPGITYGGILHQGELRGAGMLTALELICEYYANQGYAKLIYKAVPTIYHQTPAQDDVYAMFRIDASRIRCDLSSAIDIQRRLPVSERRKRSLKKAIKAGIEILEGSQLLPELWEVLVENLSRKHDVSPVHSLAEITLLAERFPINIRCVCGVLGSSVVAGVLLFITPTCIHAQYIASSEAGYAVSALDSAFEYCIEQARRNDKRWFDFGICSENSGMFLNDGLYRFKSEFGGGGVVHEFFELNLQGLGRGA